MPLICVGLDQSFKLIPLAPHASWISVETSQVWCIVANTLWRRLRDLISAHLVKFWHTIALFITGGPTSPARSCAKIHSILWDRFITSGVSRPGWVDHPMDKTPTFYWFLQSQSHILTLWICLFLSMLLFITRRIEDITTCDPDPTTNHFQALKSLLIAVTFLFVRSLLPAWTIAGSNQRALLGWRVFQ